MSLLELDYIDIKVAVKGVKNLALSNDIARLPTNKPFPVFGINPVQGSNFFIGSQEVFSKNITAASFDIKWTKLPLEKDLEAYYKNYALNINNHSFKIKIQALSEGTWAPIQNSGEYYLFETENILEKGQPKLIIKDSSHLEISNIPALQIRPNLALPEKLLLDATSTGGFFKLSLSNPNFAFGQVLYESKFVEAVTHNANYKNKETKPIPNKPIVPYIQSIALNYKASTRLNINSSTKQDKTNVGKTFLLTPFGHQNTWENGRLLSKQIVPSYRQNAYLLSLIHISEPTRPY